MKEGGLPIFTFDTASLIDSFTNWVEIIGYVAAGLTIATYSMKTMIPLRVLGICANVLFIIYGYWAPVYPQFILHCALLPLNIVRLRQMMSLVEQVKKSAGSDLSMDWLYPFTTKRLCKKGEILFRKGDTADTMFYTLSGSYLLAEIGVKIGPGQLIGEIGMVAPDNQRTQTFKCIEAGELLSISYDRVKELYFQNPQFGFYFLNLISQRLADNIKQLETQMEQNEQPSRRNRKSAEPRSVTRS